MKISYMDVQCRIPYSTNNELLFFHAKTLKLCNFALFFVKFSGIIVISFSCISKFVKSGAFAINGGNVLFDLV